MKLPDFTLNGEFNSLRQAIGAPLSIYKVKVILPAPIRRERPAVSVAPLPEKGLEIDDLGDLTVNSDGTLAYKGQRVTVHIRDVQKIGNTHHMPRFHVSNCRTLEEMRQRGRFERYVVSDRDDEFFYIRVDTGPLQKSPLNVCQNCLNKLAWDGFTSESSRPKRHSIVQAFKLKKFFERYPRSLISRLPAHTVDTAPINDYPENWNEISRELRRQLRYTCQECGTHVGEERTRYLHIHHVNGLKYDTRPDNLRCLCVRCHANQPGHDHVRRLEDYRDFCRLFP